MVVEGEINNSVLTGFFLNCQSISNKLGAVKLLIYQSRPDFVAFNETWLKKNEPKFYNYSAVWKHRTSVPGGGLGIIVKKGIQYI